MRGLCPVHLEVVVDGDGCVDCVKDSFREPIDPRPWGVASVDEWLESEYVMGSWTKRTHPGIMRWLFLAPMHEQQSASLTGRMMDLRNKTLPVTTHDVHWALRHTKLLGTRRVEL
jgi:hypothetical protein